MSVIFPPAINSRAGDGWAEKTVTATDVTGFDAIFSTGFFATFSRFCGARLAKLHKKKWKKAKSEGRKWGVRSVVVGSGVFGAPQFSVQRSPNTNF